MGQSNSTPKFERKEKCLQHNRFISSNEFHLWDLSFSISGEIAVSCYNKNTEEAFIDLYELTNDQCNQKPYYSKKFPKGSRRDLKRLYVSFLCDGDSKKIVTCNVKEIEIFNTKEERSELTSSKLDFKPSCLSVKEKRVFVGSQKSTKVIIFNCFLQEVRRIQFKVPHFFYELRDIAVTDERLFVCTSSKLFSTDGESSAREEFPLEYSNMKEAIPTWKRSFLMFNKFSRSSVTVSKMFGLVASSWCQNKVALYPIREAKPFLSLKLDNDVHRIRICNERKELVTANYYTGEIHFFDLKKLFSYSQMKECLQQRLTNRKCKDLAHRFQMDEDFIKRISKSHTPSKDLFLQLEEERMLNENKVGELAMNLKAINQYLFHIVDIYGKIHSLNDRVQGEEEDQGSGEDNEQEQDTEDPSMIGCPENGIGIDSSQRCPRDSSPLNTFSRCNGSEKISRKKLEEYCQKLAKDLGERDWRDVGRALGFSPENLEHIKIDNDSLKEVIIAMLQKWRQREGREATFDVLSQALEQAERCDLAEEALEESKQYENMSRQ